MYQEGDEAKRREERERIEEYDAERPEVTEAAMDTVLLFVCQPIEQSCISE